MSRRAICVATVLVVLGAGLGPGLAWADGIGVARFLAHNSLRPKAPTSFDRAFAALRAQARSKSAVRGEAKVVLSQTGTQSIIGRGARPTPLVAKRELLFDGKRAYLRLTTSSKALRPQTTTSVVRVPLGRLFGWYGKQLLKAQFPSLTPQQLQQGLGQ